MDIKPTGHELVSRLMTAATERRDVIAANIASQNVPGFRRRELEFESLLLQALKRGDDPKDLQDIEPEVQVDWTSDTRADGNSVDAEKESALLRENRIRFELYAAISKGRTRLVQQAVTSNV